MNLSDPRYTRQPLEAVIKPASGLHMIYQDHYWVVTPDQEVLRFKNASWQCHPNKELMERLAPEGCHVEFHPFIFIKTEVWEYA